MARSADAITVATLLACSFGVTDYRSELRANCVRRSMSGKGDCWDNAVAESFFATLRAELVDHERFLTRRV